MTTYMTPPTSPHPHTLKAKLRALSNHTPALKNAYFRKTFQTSTLNNLLMVSKNFTGTAKVMMKNNVQ